jgi:glutathione S-transferase
MYILHIGNKNYSSWSLRPWVLMKALEIPFEERLMFFEPGSSWDKFRNFSRSGLVPCLHDGPTMVWDSLAICEYLAEKHEGVWPADHAARTWARCVSSEMHSGFSDLRNLCPMSCGLRVRLHEIVAPLRKNLDRVDEIWNEGLERFGGPYLAGSTFTVADAFYAPVTFRVQTYDLPLSDTALAYSEFLVGHPAMREWYAAALTEPWREVAHEEEIAATGAIVADYRQGS